MCYIMPFHLCASVCGWHISPKDRHEGCIQCLGHVHAEAALMNGSFPACEALPISTLHSRFRFFVKRPRVTVTACRSGTSTTWCFFILSNILFSSLLSTLLLSSRLFKLLCCSLITYPVLLDSALKLFKQIQNMLRNNKP